MKPSCLIGLVLSAACLSSCSDRMRLFLKIRELDSTLDKKEYYTARFNSRADSLRTDLFRAETDSLKWEAAYSLFSAFSYMNVDSAALYLDTMERLCTSGELRNRTKVCRMRMQTIRGNGDGLRDAVEQTSVDSVAADFELRYICEVQRCCAAFPDDTALSVSILERALRTGILPDDYACRYIGLLKRYAGDTAGAVQDFLGVLESTTDTHMKALAAYNIAVCFKDEGDKVNYAYWLAQSAIYDIQVPVADYYSLVMLSRVLFDMGYYRCATKYIQISLEDAINGNWMHRIELSAQDELVFANALERNRKHYIVTLFSFVALLFVLAAVIAYLLARTIRQNRALHSMNGVMQLTNARLKDESAIKERYLFSYMEMAVDSIGRVDEYRHNLRKAIKEGGEDAVKAMLREPQKRDAYKEFYRNFDMTFLNLYPDFVSRVNELMKDGFKFAEGTGLCTDLRILATIRLGFRDSGQIARFMNIPATSVYSRRSAMRRNSYYEKGEFENRIREII